MSPENVESQAVSPVRRADSRRLLVSAVGLMTLGSGIVNIISAAGRSLPSRLILLREVFPLEFLHIFRFFSLLVGFALVISSLNIFKGKKRAFVVVLLLSGLSVIFHLTKGLDYEEAISSLVLMVALILARKSFRVRSSTPDLRSALIRLLTAGAIILFYGTLGFWLLDKSDFGITFSVADGIRRTLAALVFIKDPGLVARTRFARWFLNSLNLISVTAIVYGLYSLFRPVFYRLKVLPHERSQAAEILEGYGRSSLDPFKLAGDKAFFFTPTGRTFIAYRMAGSFAVALADPVGPEEEIPEIIRSFRELCRENDWKLAFYQTLPDFLPHYQGAGLKKMKIGDDAIVDLSNFSLDGKRMKHIRHYINQSEKAGIRAIYYEPPIPDEVMAGIRDVSDDWLRIPGRRERRFSVGVFSESEVRKTPVFAAVLPNGQAVAFMNIIRSYAPGETTIDLMRHRRDAPQGIMDTLFVQLFQRQREKGFTRFSLGLAPMSGFREGEEAGAEERAVQYFLKRLRFIFSYSGLLEYKAKFATQWEPRYTVYRNALDLPRLAIALIKVSELRGRTRAHD